MKDCDSVRESIGTWLDGELNAAESEAVRVHVDGCVDCARTQRQLESIQRTLKQVLAAEAAQIEFLPFWHDVQRRINHKKPWHEELLDRASGLFSAARTAWAIPVVILLLLGIFSLDSDWSTWRFGATRNSFASVDSIDSHGHNVALLRENESKTTVIWLYQDQEGEDEAVEDTAKSGPAF
jgi:predicted anti-sigma-YlaC factor YlaD